MKIQYAARTEAGPVRNENQDNYVADPDLGLFVVCDGMGGHRGGRRASELACQVVHDTLYPLGPLAERIARGQDSPDALEQRDLVERAVIEAHRRICYEADGDATKAGMGTTCTLALLTGQGRGVMGHVGDSRFYVLHEGTVRQLSEDHSLVGELVKKGTITEEQALVHPQANVIMRALGATPEPDVELAWFEIGPDRTFLLCSDGLHRYFPRSHELRTGMEMIDPGVGVDWMVQTALDGGGRDNITCIVFRTGG